MAGHHGVITSARLRSLGVGKGTLARLTNCGVLTVPFKGVYVMTATPRTIEQRLAALCAAHPRGFVTGPTAGRLIGLRRMPSQAGLHFAVPHGHHIEPIPGIVFRQTTALPVSHRAERADGIFIAAPPRLAFDLAADLPALDLISVLHQLLDERRVGIDDLLAIGRRLCHPARPGSSNFRNALDRIGLAPPAQSHPEIVLLEELKRRAVPVERQVEVRRRRDGSVARIDLAVPSIRWGIELDIHPEHRTLDGHGRDACRARDLHLEGWNIEPVAEADMANVGRLADQLVLLYRRRCLEFAERPAATAP